jgi:hypothetical protein
MVVCSDCGTELVRLGKHKGSKPCIEKRMANIKSNSVKSISELQSAFDSFSNEINVSKSSNDPNSNQISNVGISHMNNELLDILFKKIDGIANSNSEIISKIEFLNSKMNAIEQKLNPIERNNVVKDSNSQSSIKRSNSNTNKFTTQLKNQNQYISTNNTKINRTTKSKVNKKLYIIGLNEKYGNDQYHMINIFNWLSCDSPISTKRFKDKSSNSQIVIATFYSQKTIKLAMENATRLEKLFGYENVCIFDNYFKA